jgi:hypothetical protein
MTVYVCPWPFNVGLLSEVDSEGEGVVVVQRFWLILCVAKSHMSIVVLVRERPSVER